MESYIQFEYWVTKPLSSLRKVFYSKYASFGIKSSGVKPRLSVMSKTSGQS